MTRRRQDIRDGLLAAAGILRTRGRAASELPLRRRAHDAAARPGDMWTLLRQAQEAGAFDTALAVYRDLTAALRRQQGPAAEEALHRLRHEPAAALQLASDLPEPPPVPAVQPMPGRVAYLLNYALPQVANGYTLRAQAVAAALQESGRDVICLTRPGFPLDRNPPQPFRPADRSGSVEYRHEALPVLEDFAGLPAYLAAAARVQEARLRALRPAAVVAASNFQTALPGLVAARRLGLPFCYEVRGFWEVTQLSASPGLEQTPFYQLQHRLECLTARQAGRLVTLAPTMAEELVRRGAVAERITLAPNGCDTARFRPQPRDQALAARLGLPPQVPVIGYIGSFVQYEGLDDLIRACGLLRGQERDFRLLLAGGGPALAQIREAAAATGLADHLLLPGRIPPAEAAAYYSLIDITPFPRKPQPVTELVPPMKPLEALAMEKAVAVSSVRPLAEMIRDGETGLVFDKGDAAGLARVLDRLLDNPELRRSLGRAGRQWVLRNRSWSDTAAAIAEALAPG